MKGILTLALLVLPGMAAERQIAATIRAASEHYANVPEADGRMLRLLAEAIDARQVVEIGTSTGISGLWFSMALERTGGKLTTFELDSRRAAYARSQFERAGVAGMITIVEGDAHRNLAQIKGPVDLVFIDAEKSGYVDYLRQMLPKVRPGGLILAHNYDMTPDYVRAVRADPSLETVFYTDGNELSVTLKKR